VDVTVRNIATTLRKSDDLDKLIARAPLVRSGLPSDIIVAEICGYTDHVCHGRENAPVDFFFVYNTLFTNLRVTLSFDEFTSNVLKFLNLAPTQLHPNSWACLLAFRMVSHLFDLTPRAEVFLYYYNTYPANPISWVSLASRPGGCAFCDVHHIIQELQRTIFQGGCGAGRPRVFLSGRGWYEVSFSLDAESDHPYC